MATFHWPNNFKLVLFFLLQQRTFVFLTGVSHATAQLVLHVIFLCSNRSSPSCQLSSPGRGFDCWRKSHRGETIQRAPPSVFEPLPAAVPPACSPGVGRLFRLVSAGVSLWGLPKTETFKTTLFLLLFYCRDLLSACDEAKVLSMVVNAKTLTGVRFSRET